MRNILVREAEVTMSPLAFHRDQSRVKEFGQMRARGLLGDAFAVSASSVAVHASPPTRAVSISARA